MIHKTWETIIKKKNTVKHAEKLGNALVLYVWVCVFFTLGCEEDPGNFWNEERESQRASEQNCFLAQRANKRRDKVCPSPFPFHLLPPPSTGPVKGRANCGVQRSARSNTRQRIDLTPRINLFRAWTSLICKTYFS